MEHKRQHAPGRLELVREFVNTADVERETDEFQTAGALEGWVSARQLAAAAVKASSGDLRHAIELREALRSILLAHNHHSAAPSDACRTLDEAARRARLRARFTAGGEAALEPEAGGINGALGRLLAIVHGAMADGSWERLKACREQSCEWAFYDHTKNRSGTWCTMDVCGNRAKARAYRDRRRDA